MNASKGAFYVLASVVFGLIIALFTLAAVWHISSQNTRYDQRSTGYSSQLSGHTQARIDTECRGRAGRELTNCVQDILADGRESQRAEHDLAAQQAMAAWAFWMFATSALTLVVSVVGAIFVWRTFLETRRIGEAQTRAYVDLTRAEIDLSAGRPRVFLYVRNSGQSPAQYFEIAGSYVELQGNRFSNAKLNFPSDFKRWPGMGAQQELSAICDTAGLTDALEKRQGLNWTARIMFEPDAPTHLFVFGKLRYATVFNEVFESEFAFFCTDVKSNGNVKSQLMSRTTRHLIVHKRIV